MSPRDKLLADIAAYCQRAEVGETTFGLRALNDGKFVSRLRDGNVTIGRIERAMAFLAKAERRRGAAA